MTPEQKIHQPNTKTVKTMDKQLLEIPEEIMEKINEVFEGTNMGKHKIDAAKFGYSLAESTVKELEERLESCLGVLVSIREDLPKDGLGKIFVEKEIELLKKILKH